jgi:hypothetical protein
MNTSQTLSVRESSKPSSQPSSKPAGRSLSEDRIEEIRRRRSARGNLSDALELRLSVPEAKKDPNWVYRWVLDREMRISRMQELDWDFAPAQSDERDTGVGTRIERVINDRTVTRAEKGFLMRKPREFYEEDYQQRQSRNRHHEKQLAAGQTQDPKGHVENGYIPRSGMRIETGSYKP